MGRAPTVLSQGQSQPLSFASTPGSHLCDCLRDSGTLGAGGLQALLPGEMLGSLSGEDQGLRSESRDLPVGLVVKTLCFTAGRGFDPCSRI